MSHRALSRVTRLYRPRVSIAPRLSLHRCYSTPTADTAAQATEKMPAPGSTQASADPKLVSIVDQISELTLLQTADLVQLLKTRLNIQDVAMPVAAAAAPAAPAAGGAADAEVEKAAQKSTFNVKLDKFDAAAKAKIIREIKNLLGVNLVEAKKFVESAPKVVKENLPKEEAEKMKKMLEELGATIVLE
ncbi:mitochondrial 54S ribosomal protein bL12m [Calcarisporiella thermophila]|uniref:mitochondrial 54S ribosomal protein bL12m n=1 Tax=Calcarisporiella thermophila TaxID=911321 RepID=UPI0037445A37